MILIPLLCKCLFAFGTTIGRQTRPSDHPNGTTSICIGGEREKTKIVRTTKSNAEKRVIRKIQNNCVIYQSNSYHPDDGVQVVARKRSTRVLATKQQSACVCVVY